MDRELDNEKLMRPLFDSAKRIFSFDGLDVPSPKNDIRSKAGWDGFFPYYAGYPLSFAIRVIESAKLGLQSVIFDPWNGSGTTTYAARQLGHSAIGFDLNPTMIVIARARMLLPIEADSLEPLSYEIVRQCKKDDASFSDPLTNWFDQVSSSGIRSLERAVCKTLVGRFTLTERGVDIGQLSPIAAAFYVALFAVSRKLVKPFRSTNPTWLRNARSGKGRLSVDFEVVSALFLAHVRDMATALSETTFNEIRSEPSIKTRLVDSTLHSPLPCSVDFVLTSPPYCTRIDYTSATRIELAVLHTLLPSDVPNLSRKMTGSIRVPSGEIVARDDWGDQCNTFLQNVRLHSSKASAGYYLKTHLDYFDKMGNSLTGISKSLKPGGAAIFVVQDSYYKDVHNDLPAVIVEMAQTRGLALRRKDDFNVRRTMAGINPYTRNYARKAGAVESVLCLEKIGP